MKHTIKERSILRFLLEQGYSQSLIRQLRNTENGITVGGRAVHTTRMLEPGEVLSINIREDEGTGHIVPVPMPLHIQYEDEHILVVNKDAGVPIHPSQGNHENTLANGIAFYFKEKGETFTYRAISRLDRNTTGLLVLAKNPLSACILSDMVKKRQIRVHLKSIGHPLPGDFLYHPDYRYIRRQALHSFRLEFPHPIKKEPLSFEAPLPEDMRFLGITSTEGLWDNDF